MFTFTTVESGSIDNLRVKLNDHLKEKTTLYKKPKSITFTHGLTPLMGATIYTAWIEWEENLAGRLLEEKRQKQSI